MIPRKKIRRGSGSGINSRLFKTVGYAFLIGNCLMWFVYGYALYTWDAFLWIFGFWAIELTLAEWEEERLEELEKQAAQA